MTPKFLSLTAYGRITSNRRLDTSSASLPKGTCSATKTDYTIIREEFGTHFEKRGNELQPGLVLLFCRGHKGKHHGHSRFDIQVLISANYQ